MPDGVVRLGNGWRDGWQLNSGDEALCSATLHPAAVHSGRRALRIVPDPSGVLLTQDVPVRPGMAGTLSGWIKTDDLAGTASLMAEYRDAGGKVLQSLAGNPVKGTSRKFVHSELPLPAAPAEAATLRLGLSARLQSTASGSNPPTPKAFFDDLTLQLAGAAVALANPGFETEKLRVGLDPAPLEAYRARVAECLEQCLLLSR